MRLRAALLMCLCTVSWVINPVKVSISELTLLYTVAVRHQTIYSRFITNCVLCIMYYILSVVIRSCRLTKCCKISVTRPTTKFVISCKWLRGSSLIIVSSVVLVCWDDCTGL